MAGLLKKVVVITGASAGLGAASAVELAKYSPRLVLHGRNKSALEDVKKQCVNNGMKSDDVAFTLGDIGEEKTVSSIVQTARDAFGTINVIFNNAGYAHPKDGPIHMGGSIEVMDEMYRLYIRAPYLLTQQCLPELEKNKGVVINCSSGLARVADPKLTGYCTTKAGLDHLTHLMAISLGMKGIRVNSVNPGYVATKILRSAGDQSAAMFDAIAQASPMEQRLATPEDIAKVVVFLASDDSAALHGENVYCDMAATLTNPLIDFTQFK